jgi:hypothetical protein
MEGDQKEDGVDGQFAEEVNKMNPAQRVHGVLGAGYYNKRGGSRPEPPRGNISVAA